MSLEGVWRCVMASQHVWGPVTHWPCFLLGHSAAVWNPTAKNLQSEHSLTPSYTWLQTDTHAQCFSYPRKSPQILNGAAHMHVTFSRVCMSTFSHRQCSLLHTIWTCQKQGPFVTTYHLPLARLSNALVSRWLVHATHTELPFGKSCSLALKGKS